MNIKYIILFLIINFNVIGQIPGPAGCRSFDKIDIDNDGYVPFEINYYLNYVLSYALSEVGYDLSGYNFTLYPSEIDRSNNTNPILTSIYTNQVPFEQFCSLKLEYSGTGIQYNQADLDYNFSCHILKTVELNLDYDNDTVLNENEDLNSNLILFDDNTDNDFVSNYKDSDDDGDTTLTINEDYNFNGTVLDDDLNTNSVADYLDNLVFTNLGTNENVLPKIVIYPNPVNEILFIENTFIFDAKIYDVSGKVVFSENSLNNNLNVSNLKSGLYLLNINDNGQIYNHKFVKK
ncbi:T9SS type A sorting domain-containing protein [Flavobacterium sp.]|uniref:T9SS type A sorting domain-containing protein n=1 Tax=Flavobacterium sp. TaxID=239 RepID=UPI0037535197